MLKIDVKEIEHISHLLYYCLAHRNCEKACNGSMPCEPLGEKIVRSTDILKVDPNETAELDDKDMDTVVDLRNYCKGCKRCPSRCDRKLVCEALMWRIINYRKLRNGTCGTG